MAKVSITLPNAQITFEVQELEVIQQIVQLARELIQASGSANGGLPAPVTPEKGSSVTGASPTDSHPAAPPPSAAEPTPLLVPPYKGGTIGGPGATPDTTRTAAHQAFVEFCQSASPLTDMRRVVVAVEGASRFLGLDSVDAEELGRLFDLAGWRRPHSFVQTLRNAARRKYQWIESIPGRSGHYTVTNQGRAVVLGG
jgi:hypothetical protein